MKNVVKLIILSGILLIFAGCLRQQTNPNPNPDPVPQPSTTTEVITKVIHSTDWLMSILLLGCVVGVFAGMNGLKIGWIGTISCFAGILLKMAISTVWLYWFASICLVGCLIIGIVSILARNKKEILQNTALKEIVGNVQDFKRLISGNRFEEVIPVLKECLKKQSDTTKTIVQEVKNGSKPEESIPG